MGDYMSDMVKAERQWAKATLLLDCYYGRKRDFSKEKAEERIELEFGRTPEDLKRFMYS
jgi:hypothetical protein